MTTLKQIDAKIASFATSAQKVNVMAHDIAMIIFRHAAPKAVAEGCEGSGDCTRAVKLVRAMPASFRREMMIEWFRKYSPIRIKLSDNGDACGYDPKYKALSPEDKIAWWRIEDANTDPFYEIAGRTPETKVLSFEDLMKMVEGMAKRIEKKANDGEIDPKDVEAAHALSAAIAKVHVRRSHGKVVSNDTEEKPAKGAKAA